MFQAHFFETIRIDNGLAQHLEWHIWRLRLTWQAHFSGPFPSLIDQVQLHMLQAGSGRWRLRIEYDQTGFGSSLLQPYTPHTVTSWQPIPQNTTIYPWKYTDRSQFDQDAASINLKPGNELVYFDNKNCLIEGRYAHLIANFQNQLYTPSHYLLPGTTRQRLLATGKVQCTEFTPQFVANCSWLGFINAMLDLEEIRLHPSQIKPWT
jgi:4-amino-4-deoxychorismate lyase